VPTVQPGPGKRNSDTHLILQAAHPESHLGPPLQPRILCNKSNSQLVHCISLRSTIHVNMADRSFQEDVLVRLDTILPRGDGALASRNLKLNRQRDVIIIGRSSKRRTSLGASTSNACYDCPVMSRSHAELKLDTDKKRILLRDIGSLHGTLLNKSRLRNEEPQVLKDGDIITFGMQVERGSERYAPYEVKAGITWQPPR
jgi:pSer/pThr/pTyr-binding forkhead associated (FHA) protein